MLPGESLSIPDARIMLITQQRIPVPDSQDRDCVKIAGMAALQNKQVTQDSLLTALKARIAKVKEKVS